MAETKQNTHIDNVFNVTTVTHSESLINSNFKNDVDLYQTSNETDKSLSGDILYIPNWSVKDFINERLRYRSIGTRGVDNIDIGLEFSDPGTYFYKLFFNFNTNFGLFGGIINTTGSDVTDNRVTNGPKEINTASMYLQNNKNSERFSESYRKILNQKQLSLFKFTRILNYLTYQCPWVFKEISGLETILNSNFVDIAPAENPKITITFNQDAVDMRISTLIDLYKHACFDYTNYRVIIPENLRKFDMSIILYNPPIKGLNIFEDSTKYGNTKDLNMCFKCIILKNCEIELQDLKSFQETISNEEGFQNNLSLSVSYERSFIYSLNNVYVTETLDMYYSEAYTEDKIRDNSPFVNIDEDILNEDAYYDELNDEMTDEIEEQLNFEDNRLTIKVDGKKLCDYTDDELATAIKELEECIDLCRDPDELKIFEDELQLLLNEQNYRDNLVDSDI